MQTLITLKCKQNRVNGIKNWIKERPSRGNICLKKLSGFILGRWEGPEKTLKKYIKSFTSINSHDPDKSQLNWAVLIVM